MNPFLLMIWTTPIVSGAISMLVVSESVSSELTFFPLGFRPIFLYMDIFTYLCLDVSEVSQTQQILNRLQCIINPSNRQKFICPSAYPPIHSFIQVGNGIPHFLSLNYCIRLIACFVNPKCLIFFESLQIDPKMPQWATVSCGKRNSNTWSILLLQASFPRPHPLFCLPYRYQNKIWFQLTQKQRLKWNWNIYPVYLDEEIWIQTCLGQFLLFCVPRDRHGNNPIHPVVTYL